MPCLFAETRNRSVCSGRRGHRHQVSRRVEVLTTDSATSWIVDRTGGDRVR